MRPFRIYIDTSVIGGCSDEEFAADSRCLMDQARQGRLILLVSDIVINELRAAPPDVQGVLPSLPEGTILSVPITAEVDALRDAYLEAGVVGRRSLDDAAHVAAATVARADAIVSWNFQHIVHLEKIKGYNTVNLMRGYGILVILSPREVVEYESDADEKDF